MSIKSLIPFLFPASSAGCQQQTLITGLQAPNKIILTPQGNFLVTETSMSPNSGRLSFVSRAGVRRSLIEGLPSGTEVTLAGGSGPAAMALRDRTLYLSIGPGDPERAGAAPRPPTPNSQTASSPPLSALPATRFAADAP